MKSHQLISGDSGPLLLWRCNGIKNNTSREERGDGEGVEAMGPERVVCMIAGCVAVAISPVQPF